jgi:hypothetical protein
MALSRRRRPEPKLDAWQALCERVGTRCTFVDCVTGIRCDGGVESAGRCKAHPRHTTTAPDCGKGCGSLDQHIERNRDRNDPDHPDNFTPEYEAYLAELEAEPEDLSEDYPGQHITGPDYDTRDREGREPGDDDGVEYADPRDAREERLR